MEKDALLDVLDELKEIHATANGLSQILFALSHAEDAIEPDGFYALYQTQANITNRLEQCLEKLDRE